MSEARDLVLQVFRLVDSHDLQKMAEYLTPDVDFINPFGHLVGREAVIGNFEPVKVGFPDSQHIIPNVFEAGDVITVEGEWTGTNSGPIGTPNGDVVTNKTVRFPFAGVCKADGDLLSVVHIYHDLVVMYTQMGLM